jgi:hypothetical protein
VGSGAGRKRMSIVEPTDPLAPAIRPALRALAGSGYLTLSQIARDVFLATEALACTDREVYSQKH